MDEMSNLLKNLMFVGTPDLRDVALMNHTIAHRTSFLAAKLLEEEHAQKVCKSGAGWYIGATDAVTGEPVSRDSQYYPTELSAQQAFDARSWCQRLEP